ncbi:zinc transporter ZIP3-like [Argonauta hians]
MDPVVVCKIIVLFIVLVATVLAGLSPYVMLKFLKRKGEENSGRFSNSNIRTTLSCLNTFSGGVFLSACFIHLLPEVREHMQKVLVSLNVHTEFPATEFITMFGFFSIIVMEQYVSLCFNKSKKQQQQQHSDTREIIHKENDEINDDLERSNDSRYFDSRRFSEISIQSGESMRSGILKRVDEGNHDHLHFSNDDKESSLRSVLLLLALSLHTVFDGLTIGLEKTVTGIWSLFTAVIIHKILIGFTLGLQMFENAQWSVKRTVFLMAAFSIVSPIGIVIGIGIDDLPDDGTAGQLVPALLKALATGTFIYVTFFEILGREISHNATALQILFAILGFGAMTGLVFLE